MMIPTGNHVSWFGEQWRRTSSLMPSFSTTYSFAEKGSREQYSTRFYNRFKSLQEEIKKTKKMTDAGSFLPELSGFLINVYDFPINSPDIILNQKFFNVSRRFFREAKAFDTSLKPEEIYQALRNVWIMNGLQLMLGLPVELTPAIFAYSLLYPYSDNLLDDPSLNRIDKLLFSQRFAARLRGEPVVMSDCREEKISCLVGMIEDQFTRQQYPEVYDSLLAIHAAQTNSISLQGSSNGLSRDQIMEVSFDKGGASVLADGYLVAGRLTPSQQRFLFGYGIWLQLADDLQDIPEDLEEGVQTLFTSASSKSELTVALNRTFHFGRTIIKDISCFPSVFCGDFGKLMVHSIELMLIQSAGLNQIYFLDTYVNELEDYSPLHYEYIRKMRKKGASKRMGMVTRLVQG
jgi:hypothetical protein